MVSLSELHSTVSSLSCSSSGVLSQQQNVTDPSHFRLPVHHEMGYSPLQLSTDTFMELLDSVSLIAVIKKKTLAEAT